jgi:hypothetical protein
VDDVADGYVFANSVLNVLENFLRFWVFRKPHNCTANSVSPDLDGLDDADLLVMVVATKKRRAGPQATHTNCPFLAPQHFLAKPPGARGFRCKRQTRRAALGVDFPNVELRGTVNAPVGRLSGSKLSDHLSPEKRSARHPMPEQAPNDGRQKCGPFIRLCRVGLAERLLVSGGGHHVGASRLPQNFHKERHSFFELLNSCQ